MTSQADTRTADAPAVALGTVLGVWAHPDDEAYLSAGLMATAREAGERVVLVTATLGEHGTDDPVRWPPDRLAVHRRAELAASLAVIGVTEHQVLGYADGACANVPAAEAVDRIAVLLAEVRPDTVVTFGPDGMTGHPDHRTVSGWVTAAWQQTGRRCRLWYATTTPRFHQEWGEVNERIGLWGPEGPPPATPLEQMAYLLRCTGSLLDRKFAALRAHRTQTYGLMDRLGPARYREWWAEEAFVDAARAPNPSGLLPERNSREKEKVMPEFPAITHVALTVSDLSASVRWYQRLIDADPVLDEDTGPFHHVVFAIGGTLLGLHTFPGGVPAGDSFDARRLGLDHVAFQCADRGELEKWQQHLDELGIPHGGIVDAHYGSGLSFRDPDNIALEFFAPPAA